MKYLVALLVDNGFDFAYSNGVISFENTDTGFYGLQENEIEYNKYGDKKFTFSHSCIKGYPQFDTFDNRGDLLNLLITHKERIR